MNALEYLRRVADALGRLPGIGRRSADRMAYRLVSDRAQMRTLITVLQDADANVRFCVQCGNITTADADLCRLCVDPARDTSILCVVEDPGDILLVENAGVFRGRYHALMGRISPMHGTGPDDLRIAALIARVTSGGIREIVLALNTNVESDATAGYIAEMLRPLKVTVTRLASGIPTGSGISYSDPVTLGRALQGRQAV